MTLLVLINGAPGSGKSSLARRYVANHPLALALDIDVVRSMLGRWQEDPARSGVAARAMALAMARVQLVAGLEVLVPQYLGRLEFLLELEDLAADVDATFVEVALIGDPAGFADRFSQRSMQGERPEHRDAADLLARAGGAEEIPKMHSRLMKVVASRPKTVQLNGMDDEHQVFREFLRMVEAASRKA